MEKAGIAEIYRRDPVRAFALVRQVGANSHHVGAWRSWLRLGCAVPRAAGFCTASRRPRPQHVETERR
eukprot:7916963-Lingulodinium_polyedra.AAC.1